MLSTSYLTPSPAPRKVRRWPALACRKTMSRSLWALVSPTFFPSLFDNCCGVDCDHRTLWQHDFSVAVIAVLHCALAGDWRLVTSEIRNETLSASIASSLSQYRRCMHAGGSSVVGRAIHREITVAPVVARRTATPYPWIEQFKRAANNSKSPDHVSVVSSIRTASLAPRALSARTLLPNVLDRTDRRAPGSKTFYPLRLHARLVADSTLCANVGACA